MNAWGIVVAWSAVQVGVLLAAGAGVYLVVRRRNPAAGAWAIAAVLIAAVGLSGFALSPWPQWWSVDDVWQSGGEVPADVELANASLSPTTPNAIAENVAVKPLADESDPRASQAALSAAWREFLAGFQKSLEQDEESRAWRWPAWLAVAALVCIGLGLLRLGVALFAVHRFGARTLRVEDARAWALLAEIKRQLGCARRIELRESAGLGSPCTLGWVRPIVILPGDWRTSSESELRSVLAHEVAHVARGDFAVGILSQVGVALHFYNPLVWWLAGRLRLEQEMAADLCGARLAGGRETYLTTLARMALRQSDLPLAARPFLPARGTLLRRVEMLHKETRLPEGTVSWSGRLAVAALLLSAGGLLAGLRGPSESVAIAAPPEQPAETPAEYEDVRATVEANSPKHQLQKVQADLKKLEAYMAANPKRVTKELKQTRDYLQMRLRNAATNIARHPEWFFKVTDKNESNLLSEATEEAKQVASDKPESIGEVAKLRTESMAKLRMIGIALALYQETYKRFPAAVVLGPDGKTPHSWRVEILPFFEAKGQQLYDRYRFDEPWDSENNLKVMKDGADLFSVPSNDPSSNCDYFALVGPGSVFFPADVPTKIREIVDGTSNTIAVVEAKRDIPWTKPEDIEFEADKPLPKLGGFFEGGYNAVFPSGAVRFLPADLKDATLLKLITKAGREPWDWKDLQSKGE